MMVLFYIFFFFEKKKVNEVEFWVRIEGYFFFKLDKENDY